MLTVTLRALERDGLIGRRIYPVTPPRVDYTLTNLGESLLDVFRAPIDWSTEHTGDIRGSRVHVPRRAGSSWARRNGDAGIEFESPLGHDKSPIFGVASTSTLRSRGAWVSRSPSSR
jgi:hypothetical protein